MLTVLEGVVMELQDCALPLLKGDFFCLGRCLNQSHNSNAEKEFKSKFKFKVFHVLEYMLTVWKWAQGWVTVYTLALATEQNHSVQKGLYLHDTVFYVYLLLQLNFDVHFKKAI